MVGAVLTPVQILIGSDVRGILTGPEVGLKVLAEWLLVSLGLAGTAPVGTTLTGMLEGANTEEVLFFVHLGLSYFGGAILTGPQIGVKTPAPPDPVGASVGGQRLARAASVAVRVEKVRSATATSSTSPI